VQRARSASRADRLCAFVRQVRRVITRGLEGDGRWYDWQPCGGLCA
jgi:hypothetical protein